VDPSCVASLGLCDGEQRFLWLKAPGGAGNVLTSRDMDGMIPYLFEPVHWLWRTTDTPPSFMASAPGPVPIGTFILWSLVRLQKLEYVMALGLGQYYTARKYWIPP